MKVFLIAAICTSLAYAKPQYNYPAPSTPSGSYGAPSGASFQSGGGSTQTQTGSGFAQTGSSFASSDSFSGGFSSGGGFSSDTQSFSGSRGIPGKQFASGASSGGEGLSGGGLSGGGLSGGGLSGGGLSGGGLSGGGLSGGQGGTLIQKHIYVHVAPPEPEEVRPQRPISAGQATKHYKIIFIKAPSYQTYQQQILQQQAQNEEKTLVYVLVKKPDEQADITIPTAAPTAPSKPEVYFIRYQAKSEAVGGGATQLSGGGAGIAGSTASLSLSSASSASSQFNTASSLNTGDSSSSVSVARPQTNYGPPGQSGPY